MVLKFWFKSFWIYDRILTFQQNLDHKYITNCKIYVCKSLVDHEKRQNLATFQKQINLLQLSIRHRIVIIKVWMKNNCQILEIRPGSVLYKFTSNLESRKRTLAQNLLPLCLPPKNKNKERGNQTFYLPRPNNPDFSQSP